MLENLHRHGLAAHTFLLPARREGFAALGLFGKPFRKAFVVAFRVPMAVPVLLVDDVFADHFAFVRVDVHVDPALLRGPHSDNLRRRRVAWRRLMDDDAGRRLNGDRGRSWVVNGNVTMLTMRRRHDDAAGTEPNDERALYQNKTLFHILLAKQEQSRCR